MRTSGGNIEEFTSSLEAIVRQEMPDASPQTLLALCQCFMKDACERRENAEKGREVFAQWVKFVRERSVK